MFSLVNSSCSSSKISEHKANDKDSDLLPPQEANPAVRFEPHTTNFSIRDHVLASRSKNISASWPFPRHLLQICLKNGVRNLLPPFEPPTSARSAHSLIKPASVKTAASSVQLEQAVLVLDGSDEALLLSKRHQLDNLENDVCGVEKFSSPTGEPVLKKCRIIQKAGVISETSREEDIISSPSMASDIMASKICPVCKAFSSTSNTTLNAHMDQCLSMDSDATLGVENIHKIKVIKPRKKRLMVDIYATAPFCTLEDLDRRNGTTWATDLNSAAPNAESSLETKKPKLTESTDSRDDKIERAVYVDSNGIKIGILSKFNDTSNVLSREVFRQRNNIETVRDGKVTSSMEKYSSLSSQKMKFKLRNKKLRSLKLFENEVQAGTEVSHHEQCHVEEERSPAHLSDELDKSFSYGSATLKNWPSSKRSDLPKKSAKKSFNKIFENLKSASDTPSFAIKNHTGEFSRVLESETVNFPSNHVQNMENDKGSPQGLQSDCTPNIVLLKLSRVSRSLASLPGSTSEEFFKGRKHKSHSSPKSHKRSAEICYASPKTKKISTLSAPNYGSIKTGKHQSLLAWTDAQTRTSEIQFDQKLSSDTLTGASSHNSDVSSIMQNLSDDEDIESQMDTNDKSSAVLPIESVKQADKLTQDQLESRTNATSAQEFSACLTSHDELALAIPVKNFPINLDHRFPGQDNNSVGGQEPLVLSPASSASTISPASPEDYHSKVSEVEPASNSSTTQANLNFPFPFMISKVSKEGHHEMDIEVNQQADKPCCCSWQSIMAGNMKQKPLSNLCIKPNISSFYAYSNLRADTSIAPSMESPTDSILTKAFSDVGSTSPSCGTPTQSSSNSILRLMGKDLMVINNEESTQIPKVHSPNVHGPPSPFGFTSYANTPNRDAFSFAVHNQSPSMIGSQERSLIPGFHQSTKKKTHLTKEVIVIDDSDEAVATRDIVNSSHTMFARPFSYFPMRTHLLPMDNGIRPSIPFNQGGSFPASHLPSPFVFQSPSTAHLNSPFYYPQSLR